MVNGPQVQVLFFSILNLWTLRETALVAFVFPFLFGEENQFILPIESVQNLLRLAYFLR